MIELSSTLDEDSVDTTERLRPGDVWDFSVPCCKSAHQLILFPDVVGVKVVKPYPAFV